MNLKSWRKATQDKTVIISLLALLFLTLPGITVLSYYAPQLIISLDWIRLILLSISITGPFAVVNSIAIGAMDQQKRDKESFFYDFIMATLMTGLSIYLTLGAVYLFNTFHYHPFIFAGSNEIVTGVVVEIILLWSFWSEGKNKK